MNDATFADCRGMWSATFLPTSYCQLNITYRCGEISIGYYVEGVTIVRRERNSVSLSGKKEKKRKEKEQIVYNSTRNKRNTSKKSIRVRSGGSVYFSFPHLIESISSALRWPHGLSGISFIIRDRTNPLRFNNHDDYLTEAKARRYYTYCNERTKERAFKSCRLLFMRPSA